MNPSQSAKPRLPLACSVRDCGLPLERRERTFGCSHGHSYDVARSGYLNLLQPQDRRTRAAGDAKAAVEARARLLHAGIGRAIVDALVERAAALDLQPDPPVVDLGSGAGDALAAIARRRPIAGIGIDLSTAAVEHASRRFPDLTWVVANADRRLPLMDRSVELVLSFHGRRNPAECARVLAPGGFLLVAVPAPDDLIELRAIVQGHGIERERANRLLAEHASHFTLVERSTTRERRLLERAALLDLLRGTYRGERASSAARVTALTRVEVTLASDFFLFAPRG
ncbi:MAG: methyltransferase domain-containing protein [Acidobacteria bacterium]|nr:methyltransferase domain-containing protein [Acidobacteriota bacterium]